ncbi:MAG: glycosyltransferase family 39 protein [Legionellaceae bacterium]|nr:glycosyltransferase family 39 protein [Legionellaceae bacterium]
MYPHWSSRIKLISKETSVLTGLIIVSLLIRLVAIGSIDLIAEEAYYWNYANHLDFGYLDHPPMVAVLIKLSTLVFGINEFGVRFTSILCWFVCVFFSYKLTELIRPQAGKNAVLLLAILPFFFIHSLIITPDLPLIACWSATLYYLYLALIKNERTAWYQVGLWLGLGMLSKYTIALLGLATLIYMISIKDARRWFFSPQPYLAVLISIFIFSPVIYWNATHEWVSFLFQSTRRLSAQESFSFHALLALFGLFLTPVGIWGFVTLFKRPKKSPRQLNKTTLRFLQIYSLTPLIIFALFSLTHEIKFNWIGPSLLAIVPWLAALDSPIMRKGWMITSISLLFFYIAMLCCLRLGTPEVAYRAFLNKYIDWNDFNQQIYNIATKAEKQLHASISLIPLDRYNIASELSFYQAKSLAENKASHSHSVIGMDIFGYESLMYRYWTKEKVFTDKIALLISVEPTLFEREDIVNKFTVLSSTQTFWAHNQGKADNITPYYYQIVKLR